MSLATQHRTISPFSGHQMENFPASSLYPIGAHGVRYRATVLSDPALRVRILTAFKGAIGGRHAVLEKLFAGLSDPNQHRLQLVISFEAGPQQRRQVDEVLRRLRLSSGVFDTQLQTL